MLVKNNNSMHEKLLCRVDSPEPYLLITLVCRSSRQLSHRVFSITCLQTELLWPVKLLSTIKQSESFFLPAENWHRHINLL